jgi:hypothetical protein
MNININELQRKYSGKVFMDNNLITIVLDPFKWGNNIFKEDEIWIVEPSFLDKVETDVLMALGYTNKELNKKLKRRVIVGTDNLIKVEFRYE